MLCIIFARSIVRGVPLIPVLLDVLLDVSFSILLCFLLYILLYFLFYSGAGFVCLGFIALRLFMFRLLVVRLSFVRSLVARLLIGSILGSNLLRAFGGLFSADSLVSGFDSGFISARFVDSLSAASSAALAADANR